jgi:hypothetical protein
LIPAAFANCTAKLGHEMPDALALHCQVRCPLQFAPVASRRVRVRVRTGRSPSTSLQRSDDMAQTMLVPPKALCVDRMDTHGHGL